MLGYVGPLHKLPFLKPHVPGRRELLKNYKLNKVRPVLVQKILAK